MHQYIIDVFDVQSYFLVKYLQYSTSPGQPSGDTYTITFLLFFDELLDLTRSDLIYSEVRSSTRKPPCKRNLKRPYLFGFGQNSFGFGLTTGLQNIYPTSDTISKGSGQLVNWSSAPPNLFLARAELGHQEGLFNRLEK